MRQEKSNKRHPDWTKRSKTLFVTYDMILYVEIFEESKYKKREVFEWGICKCPILLSQ
jgi:hypothetical protein